MDKSHVRKVGMLPDGPSGRVRQSRDALLPVMVEPGLFGRGLTEVRSSCGSSMILEIMSGGWVVLGGFFISLFFLRYVVFPVTE